MQSKTELEHLLRETVEQVRNEKKNSKKASHQQINGAKFIAASYNQDDNDLADMSQQDRERVIELLLSQERVIALLYEKTFPMTSADNNKVNYNDAQNIGSQRQGAENEN
jgi:hypothetical protein